MSFCVFENNSFQIVMLIRTIKKKTTISYLKIVMYVIYVLISINIFFLEQFLTPGVKYAAFTVYIY